jgi:hypothetical protein
MAFIDRPEGEHCSHVAYRFKSATAIGVIDKMWESSPGTDYMTVFHQTQMVTYGRKVGQALHACHFSVTSAVVSFPVTDQQHSRYQQSETNPHALAVWLETVQCKVLKVPPQNKMSNSTSISSVPSRHQRCKGAT